MEAGQAAPGEKTPLYTALEQVRSGKSLKPTLEEVYAEKVLPIYLRDTYDPVEAYAPGLQSISRVEEPAGWELPEPPAPSRFEALPGIEGLNERDALRQESRLRTQLAKGVSPEELGAREELREQRLQNLPADELRKRQEQAAGHLNEAREAMADRARETHTTSPYSRPWTEEDKALQGEREKWQGIVNDLSGRYYYRNNAEQLGRLRGDQSLAETYQTAREVEEDLWKVMSVLNGDPASDSKAAEYTAQLRDKYQTEDLWTIAQQLTARKKRLEEELKRGGIDYTSATEFEKRLERAKEYQKEQKKQQQLAEEHPVWASLATVPANLAQGPEYFDTVLKGFGHSDPEKLDSYIPADVYDMYATNFVRNVRGTVARGLEEKYGWSIGGQNVASFLYQTGMNMGDFLFNALLTGNFSGGLGGVGTEAAKKAAGNLSLAIMGSGAAANTTAEAIERGLSNRQAYTLGAIAGMAEIITEKVSLEALLDRTALNKSAMGYLLKNIAAEGSEEVASDLINWAAEVLVAKDKSQWQQAIDGYKAQGMGEKEAFEAALKDQLISMAWSGVGGALSGGVMAGGSVAVNSYLDRGMIQPGGIEEKSSSQMDTSGGIIRGEKNPVKEGKGYVEERKEVRTDFARRCASEGFTVQHSKAERAGEAAAYGYRDIHIQGASAAGTVRKGLSGLGIPSFAMDGALWINWSGVSRLLEISEASAIPGEGVFINAETTVSPMEIIGHEAFHFWKGTKARDAYIEILQDNLNFSSLAFMEYQRTFQRFYFDEAVDLFDAKQMELFQEELFAYISGDLYEGTRDAKIAPMFRDFEAVKAAWKTLVAESQMGSGALKGAEEEGDMGGQPYLDDDPLVREIHRLFGKREEKEEGED